MTRKRKIAIVAGDLRLPRLLGLLEGLRADFDPTVYMLHSAHAINNHGTGLRIRVFENIAEMPGYMRDLEDQIEGNDFVVCFETSRLATFQAVRIARKLGIPSGVIVNEYQPFFYENFQNIRAVQYDVMQKADIFWPTTAQAAGTLLADGVPREKITRVNVPVDLDRFRYQPAGRAKFRNYIGIKDNEIVILVRSPHEAWSQIQTLLAAFSIVKKRGAVNSRNVRLLLAGDGAKARDLKLKSFDLGIGGHTMFLHQDCEPFLTDLYCAADLIFEPKLSRGDFLPEIPTHVLEAMACNVVPMVLSGSVAAEMAGDAGFVCNEDSPESIAMVLQGILADPVSYELKRLAAQRRVHREFALTSQAAVLARSLTEVLATHQHSADGVTSLLEQAKLLVQAGKERDALVVLEECEVLGVKTNMERAQLHLIRGDAFYALGDMDAATREYSNCMRLDDRNTECLRGLGFVSWKGHSNEEAMIFFRKAIALKQDDRKSQYGIGMVYRRLGLLEESLFWLEQSLIGPERPESAVIAYSQTCIQMNRPERAAERIEKAMDTVGEHPTLMMTLGQLYLTLGRIPEAQDLMSRAGQRAG